MNIHYDLVNQFPIQQKGFCFVLLCFVLFCLVFCFCFVVFVCLFVFSIHLKSWNEWRSHTKTSKLLRKWEIQNGGSNLAPQLSGVNILFCRFFYTPIAFNTPGHCLVRACLLHCMRVRLRNDYTQAYAQIMQHTHTHKAVTDALKPTSYSLVEGNQTIDRGHDFFSEFSLRSQKPCWV